jgi:uncharacterized Rossmann fold enzyme
MFFNEWEPIYNRIAKDFNYPLDNEIRSAEILNKIIKNESSTDLNRIKYLIGKKPVSIFGAGPSIDDSINNHKKYFINETKISADGATSALLKQNILPDIIVTDLDGDIDDQIYANKKGSLIIVHAHGDNLEKISEFVPKFKNNIIGTIQINPSKYENVFNFGGFTDGDRAVFLANHFNASKINLYGFDFNTMLGKYSIKKDIDPKIKLKKLKWCKSLIKQLYNNYHNIYFIKK